MGVHGVVHVPADGVERLYGLRRNPELALTLAVGFPGILSASFAILFSKGLDEKQDCNVLENPEAGVHVCMHRCT